MKKEIFTRYTVSTAALAASIPAPPSPTMPRKEAETSVGDGTYFSFELHWSEVHSKRSQVQIFLRCEEEGHAGSSERERGTGEGVKEGEEETKTCRKRCRRKRKKERTRAQEKE